MLQGTLYQECAVWLQCVYKLMTSDCRVKVIESEEIIVCMDLSLDPCFVDLACMHNNRSDGLIKFEHFCVAGTVSARSISSRKDAEAWLSSWHLRSSK